MTDSVFTSFGSFSRPDIGLISDSTVNLAEIFDSDRRDALRNILIRPEILDSLYKVSETVTREDLRSASGLSRLLLPSLHQLFRSTELSSYNLFEENKYYTPTIPLGGIGSPSINTPNIILYNGALRCEGVEYRANTIGSSLFGSPNKVKVSLSTSRASLFSTEVDPDNVGYFISAKYPGTIRVRRRSHVNRVFVPKTSFITKPEVLEQPTHTIQVNVDNGNTGTIVPVKLLATKNSPLRIYCKLSTAKITFTFTDSDRPYFYGYQIQPAQQRPFSAPVEFLPVEQKTQLEGSLTFEVDIDITKTGYQNLYDLYLYLYVDPEKVKGIEFSGVDIREFPDRKDLGLIGFNNLEFLKIVGGSMTILPLWLKTLSGKLKTLDLAESGYSWNRGPMSWFDIRNPSAIPSFSHPLYTAVSYLTIPKSGALINEDGNDWRGSSGSGETRVVGLFEKYIKDLSRTPGTDYRQFTALTSLRLSENFLGDSPKLDDIFPNLLSLNWSRASQTNALNRYLFGSLPRINNPRVNNNDSLVSYDIRRSGAVGNIVDIGTDANPDNLGHISKYNMGSFRVSGSRDIRNNISGYIDNPSQDWSSWCKNCFILDFGWNNSGLSINLQNNEWENLQFLDIPFSGGAKLTNSSQPLKTPKLVTLGLYGSNTTGQIFKLGTTLNSPNLKTLSIGSCNNISPVSSNNVDYLLPDDFAEDLGPGNDHKLSEFYVNQLNKVFRFRTKDLINLHNLTVFMAENSRLTGKFPIFPLRRYETETKSISIQVNKSDFNDLRNLSINSTSNPIFSRDVTSIVVWDQNVNKEGCLLPSFEGSSTTSVSTINISNSQPTLYRSDWSVSSLRNTCVKQSDTHTTISGLSITRNIQPDSNDTVFTLTGINNFRQRVQVGDEVRIQLDVPSTVRIVSVSDSLIEIDSDIPGTLPTELHFLRRTNDISNWFQVGFRSLQVFRASNCRLSGTLDIKADFSSVRDDSNFALDFSRNNITGFNIDGLNNIFSGDSRKITVNLSRNNLDISIIRSMIERVSVLDRPRKFNNCRIDLSFNNKSAGGTYSNYTQNDIFPVSVTNGGDIITSLRRNETFTVYTVVTTVDENGTETDQLIQSGTRTINVSGSLVNGTYYETRVQKTQLSQEDRLGVLFKSLRGITINLGFTYISPSSGRTIVSTEETNPITRNQSITDTGLELLPSCPNSITGTCWKDSFDNILRLN